MESVRIWNFSCPSAEKYEPENSKNGHFSCSVHHWHGILLSPFALVIFSLQWLFWKPLLKKCFCNYMHLISDLYFMASSKASNYENSHILIEVNVSHIQPKSGNTLIMFSNKFVDSDQVLGLINSLSHRLFSRINRRRN